MLPPMSGRFEVTAARAIWQIKVRHRHNTSHIAQHERDMTRFMRIHEDLKWAAAAIAQIAEDTRNTRTGQFGGGQTGLDHNVAGTVYCLLERPDEEAIRQHYAALGVSSSEVHHVDSLT